MAESEVGQALDSKGDGVIRDFCGKFGIEFEPLSELNNTSSAVRPRFPSLRLVKGVLTGWGSLRECFGIRSLLGLSLRSRGRRLSVRLSISRPFFSFYFLIPSRRGTHRIRRMDLGPQHENVARWLAYPWIQEGS